jgi:hypothetical protein
LVAGGFSLNSSIFFNLLKQFFVAELVDVIGRQERQGFWLREANLVLLTLVHND